MGNAVFYYYPSPNSSKLVTIDMGEKLGQLYSELNYDSVDSISRGGRLYRSISSVQEVVTIQRDRMILGEDLAIKLMSMQNHLDRGGFVSFCADSDKCYLFPLINQINSGASNLQVGANPMLNVVGTDTPATNDYITIQTPSPNPIIEYQKVSSTTGFTASNGGSISLSGNMNFSYSERTFLRYYRFFPTLRRVSSEVGKSIITNENGILFSLNMTLYLDDYTLFKMHPQDDGIVRTPNFGGRGVPSSSGGSGFSLGELTESDILQSQQIARYNSIVQGIT